MFCKKCGNVLDENASFCGKCGTAVEKVAEPTVENSTDEKTEPVKATVDTKNKTKTIVIIAVSVFIVVALCVAIGVVGAIFKGLKKDKPDISNNDGVNNVTDVVLDLDIKDSPAEDFEYTESSNGIVINKYLGNDVNVHIPAVINNKKVVDFTDTVFAGNVILEKVILSENITSFDLSKFENCDNLKTIVCEGDITEFSRDICTLSTLEQLCFPKTKNIDSYSVELFMENCEKLAKLDLSGIVSIDDFPRVTDTTLRKRKMTLTISNQLLNITKDSWIKERSAVGSSLEKRVMDINLINAPDSWEDKDMRAVNANISVSQYVDLPKNVAENFQKMISVYYTTGEMTKGYLYKDKQMVELGYDNRSYYYSDSKIDDRYQIHIVAYDHGYESSSYMSTSGLLVIEYSLDDTDKKMYLLTGLNNVTINGTNYNYSK